MRTAWSDFRLLRCLWSPPRRPSRGTAIHVIATTCTMSVGLPASRGRRTYTGNSDSMRARNSIRLPLSSYFIRFSVESNKAGEVGRGGCCIL